MMGIVRKNMLIASFDNSHLYGANKMTDTSAERT